MAAHYLNGDIKKALMIFKTFRLSLTESEKRIVQIAYECHTGKTAFYDSLGVNTEYVQLQAVKLLESYIRNV